MARPLSDDKKDAILAAAVEQVAALGIGAPTARIARAARVAEGTLFTYFASKDELLNQLFLQIEGELAAAMLDDYPAAAPPRERARFVWDRLIDWGAANPARRKALRQLKVSDRINAESRRCGAGLFDGLWRSLDEALAGHAAPGQSAEYVGAVLDSLAQTTLEFIAREPERHDHFRAIGFDTFWKAVGR